MKNYLDALKAPMNQFIIGYISLMIGLAYAQFNIL